MSETFTYKQISEQESDAYMNETGAKPTVLLERRGNRVGVGRVSALMSDQKVRIEFTGDDGEPAWKLADIRGISDQHQEYLAAELAKGLAGKALQATEIASPDSFDALLEGVDDGLSDEERVRLAAVDERSEEEKSLAEWRRRAREADHKHNLAKQTERIRDGGN